MKMINLLLAIHNHQPVGNLEEVFRRSWEEGYDPFLRTLENHPEFRVSLHYSGSLLEWLEENQPNFIGRVRGLVERGQVELLSGGFFEHLLPSIPERDAVGQVRLSNQYLTDKFQVSPLGLWLAERVWSPVLPKVLAPSGLKYTLPDDLNDFIEPPYEAADAAINKKRELPLIWLLPLCALLVSGWLIYKTVSEKGPEITINFPSADGLEIDKTKIKYLDVEIGKVTDIAINKDMKTIDVTAEMHKESSSYLTNNSQVWVVKPQIGLSGVTGLGTLMSGAYIAIKPEKGKEERHFKGLDTPPVLETYAQGKRFILESKKDSGQARMTDSRPQRS